MFSMTTRHEQYPVHQRDLLYHLACGHPPALIAQLHRCKPTTISTAWKRPPYHRLDQYGLPQDIRATRRELAAELPPYSPTGEHQDLPCFGLQDYGKYSGLGRMRTGDGSLFLSQGRALNLYKDRALVSELWRIHIDDEGIRYFRTISYNNRRLSEIDAIASYYSHTTKALVHIIDDRTTS